MNYILLYMKKFKKIVVLYHKDCSDGFTAAWAAWKKFGSRADYIGVEYHLAPPIGLKNRDVYLVDFCYDEAVMKKIIAENKKVVVLDHHLSRKNVVEQMSEYRFGINFSGAVLSWRYFHPKKQTPWLVRYVEDIDLWRFKLPRTREIMVYVRMFEHGFTAWDRIATDLESKSKRSDYQKKGTLLLEFRNHYIKKLVSESDLFHWEGLWTRVANSPVFRSEIGNALLGGKVKIGLVWDQRGGIIFVSLRSRGKIDVSKIAQKYGGGGHKNAAGFEIPAKRRLPWSAES